MVDSDVKLYGIGLLNFIERLDFSGIFDSTIILDINGILSTKGKLHDTGWADIGERLDGIIMLS